MKERSQMTTTTMPNNILIGSEKLFRTRAPWRINKSLLGQITNDHNVVLFDYDPDITHKKKSKEIVRKIYNKLQRNQGKVIFVGLGTDCRIAAEMAWLGFDIDAAVFVNNLHSPSLYDHMFDNTAIYNFYTSQDYKFLEIDGAECNEFVKTNLPAHMSNRLATEIAGCLMYQTYEVTYMNPTPARFITV